MKNRKKYILWALLSVILVSNLPPISYFLEQQYEYQNRDASFKFIEQTGPTQGVDIAIKRFERFKSENPNNPNKILYRNFKLQPWRFWEWWQMIYRNRRYDLPYLN